MMLLRIKRIPLLILILFVEATCMVNPVRWVTKKTASNSYAFFDTQQRRRQSSSQLLLNKKRFSSPKHSFMITSSSLSESTSTNAHVTRGNNHHHDDGDVDKNHIFVDYDKPLVLLGCSGAGDELERLAMAFVRQSSEQTQGLLQQGLAQVLASQNNSAGGQEGEEFKTRNFNNPASTAASTTTAQTSTAAGMVPLVGFDAAQGWFVMPLDELKRAILSKKYAWPDVIVVDLAQLDQVAGFAAGGTGAVSDKDLSALEFYFRQAMQLLYEELQLLTIHINVDAVSSNMKMTTRHRLERMESIMVQYSDYELCVKHEGLDPATIVAQQLLLHQQQQQAESATSTTTEPNPFALEEERDPFSLSTSLSPETNTMLQQAIQQQEEGWNHVEWELQRLVARARLVSPIPGDGTSDTVIRSGSQLTIRRPDNCAHLTMGPHTFFLSLSAPRVEQVKPFISEMCLDVDALEYRTDLLECRNSRFDLLYGMQQLRLYCRPNVVRVPALPSPYGSGGSVLEDVMPIVYTVRTCHQAGTYPDDPDVGIPNMFALLTWGLRGGVEVIDVESAWDPHRTTQLLDLVQRRYASQILGSHHVVGSTVTLEEAVSLLQQCALQGRAHGAKLVLSIDSEQKDRMAHQAALIATSLAKSRQPPQPIIPHIALILGKIGQFSRILNFPFTPVTHESLPTPAAPGQLTANEIMATRLLTNMLDRKRFCILGHNIAYSVSPQMHNAAFAATRLPHHYYRADFATVEEFVSSNLFQAHDFGGASVTIPHKQAIIPYIDIMSEAAQAIGSVNTLIVKDEIQGEEGEDGNQPAFKRVIYGDNTDWRGIYKPLQRQLGNMVNAETDVCLIVGAGGTARAAAYAAQQLGLQRIYFNRTPDKAQELADSFGGLVVSSLDEQRGLQDNDGNNYVSLGHVLWNQGRGKATVRVVISTLPASANFELPNWLLTLDEKKPIVFDVNYKPYYTQLLLQAQSKGCRVVRGSEMLWEQGVGQFELWTGRTAPYGIMKHVVLDNCLPKEPVDDDNDASSADNEQRVASTTMPAAENISVLPRP